MVNRSAGGRDTRFLRDEIRQLESLLERKEKELIQQEKELMKERKANEEVHSEFVLECLKQYFNVIKYNTLMQQMYLISVCVHFFHLVNTAFDQSGGH